MKNITHVYEIALGSNTKPVWLNQNEKDAMAY